MRIFEIYLGCGVDGGYICGRVRVYIYRYIDVCVYRVEVCTYIYVYGYVRERLYMYGFVFVYLCNSVGLTIWLDWNIRFEGIKVG